MGKGDKRRPTQVDDQTFEDRWRKTFGRVTRHETADPDINPSEFDSKQEETDEDRG